MKVILDIKDSKADFFMEMLKNFSFVKTESFVAPKKATRKYKKVTAKEPSKQQLLDEIKQAVEEIKLINRGKLKGRPAKELLDEL